jgi:hypothetical protein
MTGRTGILYAIDILPADDIRRRVPKSRQSAAASRLVALLEEAGLLEIQQTQWPLRLEFTLWAERMRTPPARASMIRELQLGAAREVHDALSLEADGSFRIQVGSFWARKGA